MEQIFINNQERFKEQKNKTLKQIIPLVSLAICGVFYANLTHNKSQTDDLVPLLLTLIILPIPIYLGLKMGLKLQEEIFKSYTLSITENEIIREQLSTPTISILFEDVKAIKKEKDGGFRIIGKTNQDVIIVSPYIQNAQSLEDCLSKIKKIQLDSEKPIIEKYSSTYAIGTLVLLGIILVSANKFLVAFAGILLIPSWVYTIYDYTSSKNTYNFSMSNVIKLLIMLLLIVFVIAGKLCV